MSDQPTTDTTAEEELPAFPKLDDLDPWAWTDFKKVTGPDGEDGLNFERRGSQHLNTPGAKTEMVKLLQKLMQANSASMAYLGSQPPGQRILPDPLMLLHHKLDLLIASLLPENTTERLRYDINFEVLVRQLLDDAHEVLRYIKLGVNPQAKQGLVLPGQ